MPKKPNINEDKDGNGEKSAKKGKPKKKKKPTGGTKGKKKKTVKVLLPAVYKSPEHEPGTDYHQEDEPMSEHEMAYKDLLLAVEMEKLAAQGLSNEKIILGLGISRDTFYRKLREEPYFSYGLDKHRGVLIHQVKTALKQNALGFTYLEQQGTAMGEVVTVMKQKLPETKAQEILLYNLDPQNWKRKPETPTNSAESISQVNIRIKRRE